MSKYIRSLKRVISDGNNGKTLEEYDFAVKAENVIVTTADGNETNVNNALIQLTEPTTFVLDNEAENWYNDNRVSWQMICDSLENNTIQNYLKVGDRIDIPVEDDETLPFFVLGINTYNGQPKDHFGKTHIDLGCPQMSKVIKQLFPSSNSSTDINYIFPLGNINSNNGEVNGNIQYATLFEKSFFKNLNNFNSLPYQSSLINLLSLNDARNRGMIKPKMLFLDQRTKITDEIITELRAIFRTNSDSVLSDLIELSNHLPSATTSLTEWTEVDADSEAWNDFYNNYSKDFVNNHVSAAGATALQRIQIGAMSGPVSDYIFSNFGFIYTKKIALYFQRAAVNIEGAIKALTGFIASIAFYIKNEDEIISSTGCHLVYNSENNSPLFWSLTETDIFGKCILGSQLYSQGQLFQYPYFKELIQKKQFVSFLDNDKSLTTITPVEGTSNQLVGYSIQNNDNLLCPSAITLPVYQAQGGTSNYDIALCFRLQA